ncbi:MAG TPA: hypothetical protein VH413_14010 [Verrucomicrobiae bacterium]|jgi:hypothetical protein|nr:hypothetical protein [Verrucomicrobiae bacterium]
MPRAITKFSAIVICSFIILAALLVASWPKKFNKRFAQIRPGATKSEVISRVGQPDAKFSGVLVLLKFGGNEAWAFSSRRSLSEAFEDLLHGGFFQHGLFTPTSEDYVIVFNRDGIVIRTQKPF